MVQCFSTQRCVWPGVCVNVAQNPKKGKETLNRKIKRKQEEHKAKEEHKELRRNKIRSIIKKEHGTNNTKKTKSKKKRKTEKTNEEETLTNTNTSRQ